MGNDQCVLVVEDEPLTRLAMQLLLERAGYRVACAGNGQEALDYLRGHTRPSLILLDLNLPVVSGWQFRESQRQEPSWASIPVVLVSSECGLPEDAERLRVEGFLQKPVDCEALLGAVWRHAC